MRFGLGRYENQDIIDTEVDEPDEEKDKGKN
jgi:hypothetical protein